MPQALDENVNIDKLLEINEQNLETELASCASYHYLFAELATDAELIYNQLTLQLEQYEVDLAKRFKQEHEDKHKGSKFKVDELKETEIKRQYRSDEKWIELKNKELEAYAKYKKLASAQKSFDMKNMSCCAINRRQLFKAGQHMEDV